MDSKTDGKLCINDIGEAYAQWAPSLRKETFGEYLCRVLAINDPLLHEATTVDAAYDIFLRKYT